LSFAVTFNKAQGMTLPKVIIDLNNRKSYGRSLSKLTWHGVALSRVRSSEDIRLMPRLNPHSFDYLANLQPSKDIQRFYQQMECNSSSASSHDQNKHELQLLKNKNYHFFSNPLKNKINDFSSNKIVSFG
jgi:hypothetical protein